MKKITVLLADDHTILRQGIASLLAATEDIQVVAEVENGRQAVEMTKKLGPDVVLMDVLMPVLNGIEAARQINRECPRTRVVVLSAYADDERVLQVIEDGATGYLVKQCAANDLVKAIREAAK